MGRKGRNQTSTKTSRLSLTYDERVIDGETYISFENLTLDDIKRVLGPLTLSNLVNLAYSRPNLFAQYLLYQAWFRLNHLYEDGYVPLTQALRESEDIAKNIRRVR